MITVLHISLPDAQDDSVVLGVIQVQ